MSFQQQLMRKLWKPMVKREVETYMIIKGKILTAVRLSDINKVIEFGKEIMLSEYEVKRSKDLKNALHRNWVEITYDRTMLRRAVVAQNQIEQQKVTEDGIVGIAKTIAKTMAEEMIKNSSMVKELAKELAKEMSNEIIQNLGNVRVERQNVSSSSCKSIDIDSSDNIFVDFKDEDVGITANINKSGNEFVQKDDLTSSLEKMKRFKKQQKK